MQWEAFEVVVCAHRGKVHSAKISEVTHHK